MKFIKDMNAVSEIVGQILLLGIAITSVSVVYTQVMSTPGPQDTTFVTIVGKIEQGCPVFELQRGESLPENTKIILTLAGYERRIFYLDQLHTGTTVNHKWNIGEQITIPYDDLTGLQVEASIVDTQTNSIVFWGILQEGLVLPSRGKGGIWHFDESYWQGIYNEVRDSSGNNNHGLAKNGAKVIQGDIEPSNVTSQNAGYFDGFNDYVVVNTSWTLNLTDTITLEAWMKPQEKQSLVDVVELQEKFGFTPYIIHVDENIYALVSEDKAKGGILATVEISVEGNITYIDHIQFGTGTSEKNLRPMITKVTKTLFLVSFIDEKLNIHLKTYCIFSNGSINYSGYELTYTDYKSYNNVPNRPSLIRVSDKLCAIAYWAYIDNSHPRAGLLKSINISADGQMQDTGFMIIFDPIYGYEPCLVHVSDDLFALAYRGQFNHGLVKTYRIASTGEISSIGTMAQFESGNAYEPCFVHVSGDMFAISYRCYLSHKNYGYVKTLNITSNGTIVMSGNMNIFEESVDCFDPCMIPYTNEIFLITYASGNNGGTKGYFIPLKIAQNGSIFGSIDVRREFDTTRCYNPIILHIDEHLFAISYEGFGDHPGKLITILFGEETFPPYRGVFKRDSYGIYANTSVVVGSINNNMVMAPISPGWHHFVVTYDGNMIQLYIDGVYSNATLYENHQIRKTTSHLYFGRYYCGFIDEVAIYDHVLSFEEIQAHYFYPGVLE